MNDEDNDADATRAVPQWARDADDERLGMDHPQTDANLDQHELYDEGLSGAAEVDPPDNLLES